MVDYSAFHILVDTPARRPALGFDAYADSLAEVVRGAAPRFAVGVFGEWGSGKTTLMHAVRGRLHGDQRVLTIDFNAWRYEREPDLIVPLLDVLRSRLRVAAAGTTETKRKQRLRDAMVHVARAARALATGTTLKANAVVAEVEIDAGKVLEAWRSGDPTPPPQSLYHAAFEQLQDAVAAFSEAGVERVVVFVDDLDRCLPANALQVLESMKLFFDLEGFVFVCGLARDIVAGAVASKFGGGDGDPATSLQYIEKIFQIQFTLPRISRGDIDEFAGSVLDGSGWPAEQQQDYRAVVHGHLRFLVDEDAVNPREVKRLINAYVVQMKVLSRRLAVVDPDVAMALQLMDARPDWRPAYTGLVADPDFYLINELRPAVEGDEPSGLPVSLVTYLGDGPGRALLHTDLATYVLAAESSGRSDPAVLAAQAALVRLRRLFATQDSVIQSSPDLNEARAHAERILELSRRRDDALARRWRRVAQNLSAYLESVPDNLRQLALAALDELDAIAREMRNQPGYADG